MKFPNPFKIFRRDKTDISELIETEKKAEPSVLPEAAPAKASGFLKKGRLRRARVLALSQKLEEIHKVADPAARLLQYRQLQEECLRFLEEAKGKTRLPGIATGVGGVAMVVGGGATLNVPLFLAGLVTLGAGGGMVASGAKPKKFVISRALARDCKALAETIRGAAQAIDSVIGQEDLARLARSERIAEAKFAFPALKERFDRAAGQDQLQKLLPPAKDDGPSQPPLPPAF